MAFNGSGTFVRLYNWVNDKAANIKVRADRMDNEMDGMATGLSTCITKDGQTTITANLPMAGFKHTGVGNASGRDDYAAAGQVQDSKLNWVVAGGTVDAITASYSPAITTLVDGQECCIRTTGTNVSTTPTFSPNGLTARTIVKNNGTALVAGDMPKEAILRYTLASTRWELLNPVYPFVPSLAPFVDSTAIIKGSADATKLLRIEVDGFTTGTTRVLTAPNFDGTIATRDGSETFNNKILVDSTVTFADQGDTTKRLAFECSGITTGTTRTVTIPDKSGTLAMTSDITGITAATAQNSTSGTAIDFTGIPSTARRVTILLYGVSTNGTSNLLIQVGNGSFVTTGYAGAAMNTSGSGLNTINATNGLQLQASMDVASGVVYGQITAIRVTGNTWQLSANWGRSDAALTGISSAGIALGSALDRVRITSVSGDTFDAGTINIIYE